MVTRAEAINSERMVLVGPDMKDESGQALSGVFAAAAVAGAIACGADPAVPLNGAEPVSYTHLLCSRIQKATATKRISAVTMRSRMEKGNRGARLGVDLELG